LYAGKLPEAAGPVPYDVSLPEAGLGWEKVGPLFERYSVRLVGQVDPHWAGAYQRVVATAPNLSRFRLDIDHATVSFTCRATDGPVEVMAVLKILEAFLMRVNREASFAAARLPAEPEASLAETPDSRRGGASIRSRAGSFPRRLVSK
jgi:hypothetical protein